MKAYTDLEQSRKLAEILPLESADMHYWKRTWKENDYAISVGHSKELQEGFESEFIEYIPCWSLAALLEIIPWGQVNRMTNSNKWEASSWINSNFVPEFYVEGYDNPVDACYEMIIKLNKQKLL